MATPIAESMVYVVHSKEVYMANILPETEVRGSLQ